MIRKQESGMTSKRHSAGRRLLPPLPPERGQNRVQERHHPVLRAEQYQLLQTALLGAVQARNEEVFLEDVHVLLV